MLAGGRSQGKAGSHRERRPIALSTPALTRGPTRPDSDDLERDRVMPGPNLSLHPNPPHLLRPRGRQKPLHPTLLGNPTTREH